MSRHKEQERGKKEKLLMELEWDEQKKLEQDLRRAREKQKSMDIYEKYKAKDAKQVCVRACVRVFVCVCLRVCACVR